MYCFSDDSFNNISCSIMGTCGKNPAVSALQDLMLFGLMGLSVYAYRLRQMGVKDKKLDDLTLQTLFTTVVSVDFDKIRLQNLVNRISEMKKLACDMYLIACKEKNMPVEEFCGPAEWVAKEKLADMIREGERISNLRHRVYPDIDVVDLRDLIIQAIKGIATYADYAKNLGREDDAIYEFFYEILSVLSKRDLTKEVLTNYSYKCGEVNLKAIKLLEDAIVDRYGSPTPTSVRVSQIKGTAILVSGNNIRDLEEVLKITEGKGINVYTHGDMIAAHSYPELKKFPQLVGHYGKNIKSQQSDFQNFPGAVLLTSTCLHGFGTPCRGRLFTTGLVSAPGIMQLKDNDFKPLIKAAYDADGFDSDEDEKFVTVGYGHNGFYQLGKKITEGIKNKEIEHVFVIGGCDGATECEQYYKKFVELAPKKSVILALNLDRELFNEEQLGEIAGIPRFIKLGQCNTVYTVYKIAEAMSVDLGLDISKLPMHIVLSWYDQRIIAFLMTMLNIGFKNIKVGPGLPSFVPPNVYRIILQQFNLQGLTNPEKDLNDLLG